MALVKEKIRSAEKKNKTTYEARMKRPKGPQSPISVTFASSLDDQPVPGSSLGCLIRTLHTSS